MEDNQCTSNSNKFDEEWEYRKAGQRRLNRGSPSHWTKTSKAKEGGDVALNNEISHKVNNKKIHEGNNSKL